jgi:hypothetical protein
MCAQAGLATMAHVLVKQGVVRVGRRVYWAKVGEFKPGGPIKILSPFSFLFCLRALISNSLQIQNSYFEFHIFQVSELILNVNIVSNIIIYYFSLTFIYGRNK